VLRTIVGSLWSLLVYIPVDGTRALRDVQWALIFDGRAFNVGFPYIFRGKCTQLQCTWGRFWDHKVQTMGFFGAHVTLSSLATLSGFLTGCLYVSSTFSRRISWMLTLLTDNREVPVSNPDYSQEKHEHFLIPSHRTWNRSWLTRFPKEPCHVPSDMIVVGFYENWAILSKVYGYTHKYI
jgi:hypothetical protein